MRPRALFLLALISPGMPHAAAQSVIAARSGLINYFEGNVLVNDQRLERKYGAFTMLKEGSELLTLSGRVEVLLTPNTYLRVGENSGIRMISDSLSDTRIELLGGSAMIESANAPAATPVTIVLKDSVIRILKPGNYRVDAEPPQLRVYKGEAQVMHYGNTVTVGEIQLYALDGASVVKRFTDGSDALLDMWSQERRILISNNLADARTIFDPLVDPGPNVTDGLNAYLGYVPLIAVPTLMGDTSYGAGYGPSGYGPSGYGLFSGYPLFSISAPAYRFGSIYLNRPPLIPGGYGWRPGIGLVPSRPPIHGTTPYHAVPLRPMPTGSYHPVTPHPTPHPTPHLPARH